MQLLFDGSWRSRRARSAEGPATQQTEEIPFRPAQMLIFDITADDVEVLPVGRFSESVGPEEPSGEYELAHVLVRLHGAPLGVLKAETGPNLVDRIRDAGLRQFSAVIRRHLLIDGIEASADLADDLELMKASACSRVLPVGAQFDDPLVTVVIPTLRNLDRVVACVDGILKCHYEKIEVLVVNNDPESGALEKILADTFAHDRRVRYAHQPIIGVSHARNLALDEAKGELLVFADDDVVVDPNWIGAIVEVFQSQPDAACVTGPILAAEMETQAQHLLEQFGGFEKGFERQIFDMGEHRRDEPMYPFDAGRFGSGANMSFRIEALRELGGFATDLGPGTSTFGGEDIDLARRLVWSGHQLVYEPSAVVWHFHRRRYDDLARTLYRYGVGLGAMVTKSFFESPRGAFHIMKSLPAGAAHMFSPKSEKNRKKSDTYPSELSMLEIRGLLVGPVAYFRTRLRKRRR
jgi:GT2 family glycosyltransferase